MAAFDQDSGVVLGRAYVHSEMDWRDRMCAPRSVPAPARRVRTGLRNLAVSRHRLDGTMNDASACRHTTRHPERALALLTQPADQPYRGTGAGAVRDARDVFDGG